MDDGMVIRRQAALLDAEAIAALHDTTLTAPGWPHTPGPPVEPVFLRHVLDNHRLNSLLWNEEDQARRADVPDSAIAANKRAIDGYNQRRNDAVEAMDETILRIMAAEARPASRTAWVNSETAGSIVDRLSIGALKIHHMGLQVEREDVDAMHRKACLQKLERLRAQREHLSLCLRTLIDGMLRGACTYRAHHQFKMYNDPALNPCLYAAAEPDRRERP